MNIEKNVDSAANQVWRKLVLFSETIAEQDREAFFHPINRDHWVAAFCEWLAAKQVAAAQVRASND